MVPVEVNTIAVIGASITSMIIGFIWYGPMFGKAWMKEMRITQQNIDKAKKQGMMKQYIGMFIGAIISAYVLANIIFFVGAMGNLTAGAITGFWIWLGFIATVLLGGVLFENKTTKWYMIVAGYQLVNFLIIGAIIAMWV
jgi:uncharacterized protein YacL